MGRNITNSPFAPAAPVPQASSESLQVAPARHSRSPANDNFNPKAANRRDFDDDAYGWNVKSEQLGFSNSVRR